MEEQKQAEQQWNKIRRERINILKEAPSEENLWQAVMAFQDYPFKTVTGLPFQYTLKTGKNGEWTKELWIDRREKSKSLSWSSVVLAFKNSRKTTEIVKRPKALGDIRGISYIYPILWRLGLIRVPEKFEKKMACDDEKKLSGYFQTGYLLKKIGSFEGNGITVNHADAPISALKVALLVLIAGCGLVGAMAVFTDKVHSVEQAQQLLDMDVFGALPFVKKKQEQKSILITDPRTSSQYAEAVDKIVTKLRRKMHENHYKVLMVSSLKENDGKSTAAANLVLNLVQRGKKVVLVDCDMRRSAVCKLFDIDMKDQKQLYDYLTEESTLQDVLIEYGQDERKFSCILQKKAVSEPEKLFDSERFEHMLKELSGSFDYVILDTAPIGIVRDAEIIAGYADSVFMVMKQDEVHAASVNDVIDILEDAGSVVVGGVLNMARGEKIAGNGYHKYKYGSYYYGYAYGKDGQHAGK